MADPQGEFEEMMKSPSDHFDNPQDIVDHTNLSHDQKLALLRQWEFDEREKSVASEENMAGGEENRLADVAKALQSIGAHGGPAPTKQGS